MKSRVVRARDAAAILSLLIDLVLTSMRDPNLASYESWRLASIVCLKKVRDAGTIEFWLIARDEIKAWVVNRWRRTVNNALRQLNAIIMRLPTNVSEREFLSAMIGLVPGYGASAASSRDKNDTIRK